jgi:hypothetical protein
MTEHRIQDFAVVSGAIARNDEGLIEGRLMLTGDVTLVFVMDKDGARWHWQPEDPTFAATRLGMFGTDTDQPSAPSRRRGMRRCKKLPACHAERVCHETCSALRR